MRVCRTVCSETQGEKDHAIWNCKVKDKKPTLKCAFLTVMLKLIGSYGVILDERHYKELLMQHVIPPVAKVCTS